MCSRTAVEHSARETCCPDVTPVRHRLLHQFVNRDTAESSRPQKQWIHLTVWPVSSDTYIFLMRDSSHQSAGALQRRPQGLAPGAAASMPRSGHKCPTPNRFTGLRSQEDNMAPRKHPSTDALHRSNYTLLPPSVERSCHPCCATRARCTVHAHSCALMHAWCCAQPTRRTTRTVSTASTVITASTASTVRTVCGVRPRQCPPVGGRPVTHQMPVRCSERRARIRAGVHLNGVVGAGG